MCLFGGRISSDNCWFFFLANSVHLKAERTFATVFSIKPSTVTQRDPWTANFCHTCICYPELTLVRRVLSPGHKLWKQIATKSDYPTFDYFTVVGSVTSTRQTFVCRVALLMANPCAWDYTSLSSASNKENIRLYL